MVRIIDFVHIGSEEGLTDAMTLAVFLMLISNIILYISTFVVGRKPVSYTHLDVYKRQS